MRVARVLLVLILVQSLAGSIRAADDPRSMKELYTERRTALVSYSDVSHGKPASPIFLRASYSATDCWPTFFMTFATSLVCTLRT